MKRLTKEEIWVICGGQNLSGSLAVAQAQLEQDGEETRKIILAVQDMLDGMGYDSESFRRSDWLAYAALIKEVTDE